MKAFADTLLFLVIAVALLIVWPFTNDHRDGDDE